jgi:hypothetical protein
MMLQLIKMPLKYYLMILLRPIKYTYISKILLEEIDDTTNEKIRKELQGLVNRYKEYFKILEAGNEKIDEITFLAGEYIKEK